MKFPGEGSLQILLKELASQAIAELEVYVHLVTIILTGVESLQDQDRRNTGNLPC